MGRRGPAPTPASILRCRGSWRAGKRAEAESIAPEGVLAKPGWLSDDAAVMWDRLLPLASWWRPCDAGAIARYCDLYTEWLCCTLELRRAKKGVWKRRGTLNAIRAQLLRMEEALGLTPAARMRGLNRDIGKATDKAAANKRLYFEAAS